MYTLEVNDQINQVLKELTTFELTVQNKIVRSGLVSLSKPLKKSMATNAPKNKGYLSQSINHKTLRKTQKARLGITETDIAIIVGPNKKVNGFSQSRKANLIEGGVKAHKISPKDKSIKIGNNFVSGDIHHPGVAENPFMADSLSQNESNLANLFYQGMTKTLDRIRAQ